MNQLRSELKDPLCLEIPSLRKHGNENKVTKVIKVDKDEINASIIQRINDL